MSNKNDPGFVLGDLVLPMGIGAVLLSSAWPGQSSASIAADDIASNESAAIAALRSIASAQAQLACSGAIDTDDDGVGEYGYFGELAGTALLRFYDPITESPEVGAPPLTPPLLPPDYRNILFDARNDNVVIRNGYVFKMFLPDVEVFLPNAPNLTYVEGIAEWGPFGIGGATSHPFPDPDTGEALWCCYAWPLEGQDRAFFVNQQGRILQTRNDGRSSGPAYEGLVSVPDFDAAYSDAPEPPNGITGMGAPLGNPPRRANDGNRWTPIGR